MTSPWTEERTAALRRMWNERDRSGAEISRYFAKQGVWFSRSAVIAKARRLKLERKAPTLPRIARSISAATHRAGSGNKGNGGGLAAKLRKQAGWRSRDTSKVTPPRLRLELLPPPVEPLMLTLMEIKDGQCKWPMGDPRDKDFGFCGHRTFQSGSYCEYHDRVAYQPVEDRHQRQKQAERELVRFA